MPKHPQTAAMEEFEEARTDRFPFRVITYGKPFRSSAVIERDLNTSIFCATYPRTDPPRQHFRFKTENDAASSGPTLRSAGGF